MRQPDVRLARAAADASLSGLSFYRGIPGTIGGAIAMNAGAYGGETSNVLIDVEWLDRKGQKHVSTVDELGLSYRHNAHEGFAFIYQRALTRSAATRGKLLPRWKKFRKREDSQPG